VSSGEKEYTTHAMLLDSDAKVLDILVKKFRLINKYETRYLLAGL
jgi:hypothetical protein